MKRIRHIATAWNGSRVAVAALEQRVAIWDIISARKISEFDSVLDFGGTRLAITSDGERILAGAYHRNGIACYGAATGNLLWRRKDLKRLQHVSIPVNGESAYCGFEGCSGRALSLATGADTAFLRGVREVCTSPFDDLAFFDRKSTSAELRSRQRGRVGRIERTTFAFLSVAFAPRCVLTSESGGPLRCFDTSNAQERWRHVPEPGMHALRVAFDAKHGLFDAIIWPYERGGNHKLSRFDPMTGSMEGEIALPESFDYGYCLEGTALLTCDGSLISTQSGRVLQKLDFPDTSDA